MIGYPRFVKRTKNLILLKKENKLLLINGAEMRPLLISRGRDFILDFLDAAESIKDTRKILERYHDEELLAAMLTHKILISTTEKENYRLTDISNQIKDRKGMSLYLLLSQGCNLSCIYCLNGERTYRKSEKLIMSEKVAFRAVESCLEMLSSGGELEIVFFGGEPLLNWALLKNTIVYCEESLRNRFLDRKWRYHITTNLTIFPKDFVEWIKRYNITILCDIDGPPHVHDSTRPFRNGKGSHHLILRNIGRLQKEDIRVSLRSTITSHNVDCMLDIAKHHKEIGGVGCAFVAVNPVTSDEEILPEELLPDPLKYAYGLKQVFNSGVWPIDGLFPFNQYLKMIKPGSRSVIPCGAPYGNTPVIDINGDIYACIYLVGIKSYRLGNIFDEQECLDTKVIERMTDILNIDNVEGCRDCNLRYICVGGCPIGRLSVAGNPKATKKVKEYVKEIMCTGSKVITELILWNYAEEGLQKSRDRQHNKIAVC